jgi:hypothetical protein
MGMFDRFFGGYSETSEQSANEAERLKERQRLLSELGSFDLTPRAIEAMSPDTVHNLNQKIGGLQMQLQEVSRPERMTDNARVVPPSESIASVLAEEDILKLAGLQPGPVKDFYRQLFDDQLLDCVIAEKLREYDIEHWQEVFSQELKRGKNPFGDETQFFVDFYQRRGIDIVNPLPLDIEAFFERRRYNGGAIGNEIRRRRNEKHVLSEQDWANVHELFWKLFRIPDGKGWFNTLADKELKKKLLELRPKVSRL